MGSSFFYARPLDENGEAAGGPGWLGTWSAWGETAATRFSGADGPLSLNGEVATATLGADSRWGRWHGGVALSHSEGQGVYTHPEAAGGAVTSTLTSLHPFARYELNDRTSLWGVLGYGSGALRLTPEGAETGIDADLATAMAAFGGRGVFSVRSSRFGAFEFAVVSDARVSETVSDSVENLMGTTGATSRVRVMFEGSGSMPVAWGGVLRPSLEAGLRYDGANAEFVVPTAGFGRLPRCHVSLFDSTLNLLIIKCPNHSEVTRMASNKWFGPTAGIVATAALLSPATETMAQEVASGTIEEIVVTAHRREENLLEIAESVSVISGADISRQNIKGLEDVGFLVPNLNLSTRLDGFPNVSVRGLGAFGNTQGVGFYLDDVQLFSDASSRFGDLERIEILKGPQGTLYGGSNIGGAVKFVSARPDSEDTFGRVKAVLGDQGVVDVEGSVNLRLGSEGWAMRAFGFSVTNDGYLSNPNPMRVNGLSGENDEDIGQTEESGVRISLAGPLGNNLSAYASVRTNDYEGPNNTWIRELDETSLSHPNTVPASINPRHERDTVSGMLELTWTLEGYDITSVTSYTSTESSRFTDLDQREEYLLSLFRPEDMDVMTQEIRFTSTAEGQFQWLGGVYYSEYEEKMDSDLIWYNTTILPSGNITGPLGCAAGMETCSGVWAGDSTLTLAQERDEITLTPFEKRMRDKSHLAAFINATYTVGDWEWSLGLRGDRWENDTFRFSTNHRANDGATEVLPRISLTRWLSDSSMLYGTMSQGYEPGGFNVSEDVADELVGFDSEEAVSYEAGWKGRLMDGRMTASVAAFFVDYDRRQIETQIPTAGAALVELINNVGDSKQHGLEMDMSVALSDSLSATFSAGWIEADWDSGTTVITGGDAANPELKNIGGDVPPVTPDFSWSIAADYVRPMSGALSFIAGVQVSHNGKYTGLRLSDPEGLSVINPSFTLVSAQVGVTGDNWELALNVENLLDEDYYTDVQTFPDFFFLDGDADEIIVIGTLGQPQLVTASFSYFF